ncbi:MAG: MGMT family protein, partial [Thermoanaerobaculia bacterium]
MAGAIYDSRLGSLTIVVGDDGALEAIHFGARPGDVRDEAKCREAVTQLDEYFRGERTQFTIRLAPKGTEFQRAVWNALLEIPFGSTVTYGDIA